MMSSCGLKASEGQRFNRKWREERDAGHILLESMKAASEAAGQTPPVALAGLLMELVSLLVIFRIAFTLCICFAALVYKVIYTCVVNWIPGTFPELCWTLISFRTAVEPFSSANLGQKIGT